MRKTNSRASRLIAFDGGEVSTFDIGYTAGTAIMNLQLVGTKGIIEMDDFVLDWHDSFAFRNPDIEVGYSYRTGMATRNDVRFVPTPATSAQERSMVEDFAALAARRSAEELARYAESSLKTQEYLDALWQVASFWPVEIGPDLMKDGVEVSAASRERKRRLHSLAED